MQELIVYVPFLAQVVVLSSLYLEHIGLLVHAEMLFYAVRIDVNERLTRSG